MAQFKVGEHYFNNGDEVEFYLLNDYREGMKGKMITLKDIPSSVRKDKGKLIYKKGWMTSRWVIINGGPTAYEIELTNYNVLNTNPFSSIKNNILFLDSHSLKAQTPDIGSMETLTTEGEEFRDGDKLTFTQSWNKHAVKTQGILRKRGDQWIIEYNDRGYKIEQLDNNILERGFTKLQKIPTYVPPSRPPPRVLTEEERLAIEAQNATEMEEKKEREAEENRKRDADAELLKQKIMAGEPATSRNVLMGDRVKHKGQEATVVGEWYEIEYLNKTKAVVKLSDLINMSAVERTIKQEAINQSNRNFGGTRKRRRKNRKTRYGMERRT